MNVKIYPEMIPKEHIRISIYLIPIHLSPVPAMGLITAKSSLNGTEKRQKIRDIRYMPTSRLIEVLSMPRMSKKRKLEWAYFLNHRNRITYNELCRKCVHGCKQSFRAEVITCPRYQSKHAKED